MDNIAMDTSATPSTLSRRFDTFLQSRPDEDSLRRVFQAFQRPSWEAHLFGGLLRDILLNGVRANPRDVDLVLAESCIDEVADVFSDAIERKTRFGGLHLHLYGWHIDVWSLEQTWAFHRDNKFSVTFQDLPKTTFLDVDAVAMQLFRSAEKKSAPGIFESGFFRAMNEQIVDVNFEPNPYPELCVVRGLEIAERLGFALGPDLVAYIAEHAPPTIAGVRNLADLQRSHYGTVRLSVEKLHLQLQRVREHHRRLKRSTLSLIPST